MNIEICTNGPLKNNFVKKQLKLALNAFFSVNKNMGTLGK
jgi:hypothetical protein